MTKLSDEWQTPKWLFQELEMEHGPFDIDLCATKDNSKCGLFYRDYLKDDLEGEPWPPDPTKKLTTTIEDLNGLVNIKTAFMNPPYSNPRPFIEKAWEDSKHCKIICLVKCDPSTKWWAAFWEYNVLCPWCEGESTVLPPYNIDCVRCGNTGEYSGPKPGCEVRFFPKRIQFDPPQQLIDSGEVRKVGPKDCIKCRGKGEFISCNPNERYPIPCFECPKSNKWVQKCKYCLGGKELSGIIDGKPWENECIYCNALGYKELSGPTFPSALLIFDRRKI